MPWGQEHHGREREGELELESLTEKLQDAVRKSIQLKRFRALSPEAFVRGPFVETRTFQLQYNQASCIPPALLHSVFS